MIRLKTQNLDGKYGIVDPSQCPKDHNCGSSTMTNLERPNDVHRAIGSEVLATECVEHILAADPVLPDVATPTVVCLEHVVFRENDTSESHNVVGGVSIQKRVFFIGRQSSRGVPYFQCS